MFHSYHTQLKRSFEAVFKAGIFCRTFSYCLCTGSVKGKFTRLASSEIKRMRPIFENKMLIYQSKAILDEKFCFAKSLIIDKVGYGLFIPISSPVINLFMKHLLISPTNFMPRKK